MIENKRPGEVIASGERRGSRGKDGVFREFLDLEQRWVFFGDAIGDMGELWELGIGLLGARAVGRR